MKRIFLLIILSCIFSCKYFNNKKVHTEELLQEELKTFNWKDVINTPHLHPVTRLQVKNIVGLVLKIHFTPY